MLLRLKEFIDFKGVSISKFEKSIGMSNASFGKSLKNNGTIGADKLDIILKTYPDLNLDWLITGKGEMIKSHASISYNSTVEEPGYKSGCKICAEKDKRIDALERIIQTQSDFIDSLKNKKCSSSDEQKRKVG